MTRKAPDGRIVHIWDGNVGALAAAIAHALPQLCNRDGAVAKLESDGSLSQVALHAFRELVGTAICTERVVADRTGKWAKEYVSFAFAPLRHPGPRTNAQGLQYSEPQRAEPDAGVIDELFKRALPPLLPRVVA